MHAQCWCTERASLERRVFVDAVWTHAGRRQMRITQRRFGEIFKTWDLDVLDVDEAVLALSKAKRRRYIEAAESLKSVPVERRDAKVAMFVKADKLNGVGLEEKKPRAIQGRSPRYNLALARYLKPIEHALMGWKGPKRGVERTRLFAKGLNSRQRASLIIRKTQAFRRPRVVSVDASSFDASVASWHLELVHGLYLRMTRDPEFERLLTWQIRNFGRTQNGHSYKIVGNRMSGDVDTGIGNSILNAMVFTTVLRVAGVRKWDMLCDGDDALLFVEDGQLDFHRCCEIALTIGFRLTGEEAVICDNFYDIEFCRSRPVWTPQGYTMCRIPSRAVSCFGCSHRYAHWSIAKYKTFLAGCGVCELTSGYDLPMISHLAYAAANLTTDRFYGEDERYVAGQRVTDQLLESTVQNMREPRVHPRTRAEVAEAFGVSVDEQLAYEDTVQRRIANLDNAEVMTRDALSGHGEYLWLR